MGGKPESIYTDDEGSFNSTIVKKYLQDENIKHIITLTHPYFVERLIRTIKVNVI
jgi:precorrin-6x reductase